MTAPESFSMSFYMDRVEVDGVEVPDPTTLVDLSDVCVAFSGRPVRKVYIDGTMSGVPDLLSYVHYETSDLWWFICLLNRISDPFRELGPGKVVYVPMYDDIAKYLSDKSFSKGVRRVDLDE